MTSSDNATDGFAAGSRWHDQLSSSRLLMSTGDTFNIPLNQGGDTSRSPLDRNNHFKSCQWCPDGTSLLTSNADNILRTFILPPDLLEDTATPSFAPYHQHSSPEPVYATAIHPGFSLTDTSTAIYLASVANLPLRLISPFSPGILASYPLVNPNTEAYVAPHSLAFNTDASRNTTNFFAGSDSQIDIFDLNRPGGAPHTTLRTIPSKRKKLVGGGVGMKGLVSSLGLSSDGLLAAGTFTKWIGLYDSGGMGSEVGVFQLGKNPGDRDGVGEGSGVTQVLWTPDGRYLVAAERMSDGLSVWDVRGTGRRLTWLAGRNAMTMQRMNVDIVENTVIAGDTDGNVQLWGAIGNDEGVVQPTTTVKLHEDAVPSAVMHPSAAVMATCSGQRHESLTRQEIHHDSQRTHPEVSTDDGIARDGGLPIDNSLKIWSLYPNVQSERNV